jgi:hypothetical protein
LTPKKRPGPPLQADKKTSLGLARKSEGQALGNAHVKEAMTGRVPIQVQTHAALEGPRPEHPDGRESRELRAASRDSDGSGLRSAVIGRLQAGSGQQAASKAAMENVKPTTDNAKWIGLNSNQEAERMGNTRRMPEGGMGRGAREGKRRWAKVQRCKRKLESAGLRK